MSSQDETRPLLPSLADQPRLQEALRASLEVLRNLADPELRPRIDQVIAGQASLRELSRDEGFADLIGPLAERGWTQWEALPEEERAQLLAQADAPDVPAG